ncbi:MAG: hypothetical protein FJZ56_03525 [Chlamydiae bacterium]|nr:hypothetical protein [Chlamydiota bacterium]
MNLDIEALKKDLCIFRDDIELIMKKKQLIEDQDFIKKFASDVRKLDRDSYFLKSDENVRLIHYFLSTPIGAPFVSNCSLLEAAIMCKKQAPLNSMLHTFLKDLVEHSDTEDVAMLQWIEKISQKLQ